VTGRTQAAQDVLAERQRQIDAEGWTPEHDDKHATGSMAVAAACYALSSAGWHETALWEIWPKRWGLCWLKPKGRRHDLVRAGALVLAELERLDRAEATPKWQTCAACTSPEYCRESLRGCDIDEMTR
jgi:hypothetical protein